MVYLANLVLTLQLQHDLLKLPLLRRKVAVAQFNLLFTPVAANNVTAPQANSPCALPKLTIGGAASAA